MPNKGMELSPSIFCAVRPKSWAATGMEAEISAAARHICFMVEAFGFGESGMKNGCHLHMAFWAA
jgi:hypothetical protein